MYKPQARSIPGVIHQNNQHCCNATKTLYKDASLYNLSLQYIGVPQTLKPSRDRESHFTGLSDSYGQNSPNNRGGEIIKASKDFDFRLLSITKLQQIGSWQFLGQCGTCKTLGLWKKSKTQFTYFFKENKRTPASYEALIYPLQHYCSPSER